jgi:nucleoid DNA-binding protein
VPSVTKKDLAKNITNKLGLSSKDSLSFVSNFFSFLIENHSSNINISNFGSFTFKRTPSRVGRNPKTKQAYKIKARKKLNFKPAVKIKYDIN